MINHPLDAAVAETTSFGVCQDLVSDSAEVDPKPDSSFLNIIWV